MKKILHFTWLLLAFLYSSVGNSQISDYQICDVNNNGYGVFDLTTKIDEILNGENPSDYIITFHVTNFNAQWGANPISLLNPYPNITPYEQEIYVRIVNLNDSTFVIESFNLVVLSFFEIGQPVNLFNSNGVFDLTTNILAILNDNSDLSVTLHLTHSNAEQGILAIANETSYLATSSPQTIYARIESTTTDCFVVTGFHLILNDTDDIVYIPNVNFKNKLLQANTNNSTAKNVSGQNIKIDINNDGEIQVSEALNAYQLIIPNSYIGNLTGIEAFTNLTYLMCRNNNLTQLDLSNNVSLGYLECEYNNLTNLDISNINLTKLTCFSNNLTELDVSNNVNLTSLSCGGNSLTELDVSNNVNLTSLVCNINSLTELDVSNNINLASLFCNNNTLTELDVSNNINLTTLSCGNNSLTELDVSNNVNLTYLNCINIGLTGLDVSNNVNLTSLGCGVNSLTELDVSNNINLEYLSVSNNLLTQLDVSNNPNLNSFSLYVDFNPLQYLNIKNGKPGPFGGTPGIEGTENDIWGTLPDNIYICADEEEIGGIQLFLNQSGATGQVISTYCSFNPAGDYNTITGIITYDFDTNGCDENDNVTTFTKVIINDSAEEGVSFTNQNGEYIFFTQDGEFTIILDVENPSFFNITPVTETVTFANNDNNVEVVNFCVTPNGVHNDLEVVIAPTIPARPGFEATYKIVYRNKGNQVLSQDYGLSFVYNHNLMSFVSATVTPDTQGFGAMNWTYEDLMPFESREIVVTMLINTPMDSENPVNIDDELILTSVIMPQSGDENVQDNIYILNQTVVGAYDPNDITCIEGDVVHPNNIGEELHYVIRFENTGNFYAENVLVVMEIDMTKYDVDSVRLLNTSHNALAQIKNDVLEIFFNQIYLNPNAQGDILFVINTVNTLSEGDYVQSKADIYFDYNYPIITNDAVTLFQATMSVEENIKNIDLRFYPNPTTDYFNITSEEIIQLVELYDTSGRLIRTSLVNDFESKQNISNLTNGVYILKIKTNKGEVTGKIVKK